MNAAGHFLRQARIAQGLTQKDVADKFKFSSAQFVSNWERGLVRVPPERLKVIAKMYKLPVEDLVKIEMGRIERAFRKRAGVA